MGKKGTKRKTTWRTLSITDSTDDATVSKNGISEQSREQASSKHDRYSNSSYLRRKPLFGSSAYVGRSDYTRNYNKQNSALSSSSSYSSRNSYHRRPFQNSASRFFNFRTTGRTTDPEGNRIFDGNKENYQTRPSAFNEEEYTRITTPRQDVIFKKGYLSQPRKYLSSTDTNTTSSAAASIVSNEESISAASVPSLSPEQCSSYADSIDPEQALMYSYFDQNGVFYINPCLPNGFDQYSSQMFMLPYSYPPYSVYLSDLNSPIQSTDIDETSTDSNENLSDKGETNIKEMSKESEELPNDCDSKPEPPNSEETKTVNNTERDDDESTTGESEHIEVTPSFENIYNNCEYQQFYPPVFFPYVYGQQFMPVIEAEYSRSYSECNEDEENDDQKAASCKTGDKSDTKNDGNSTGATTPDCSEEDCNDKVADAAIVDEASCDTVIELKTPNNEETEKKIIFNANAKEFIPRLRKSHHLNVNVKEFLPSNVIKPKGENAIIKCSNENDTRVNYTIKSKENVSLQASLKTEEKENSSTAQPKNQSNVIISKEKVATNSLSKNVKEKPTLTLAERIKKGLAAENVVAVTSSVKSSPPKNNPANIVNNKKTPPKRIIIPNEKSSANEKSLPVVSFAQMLTKSNQKVTKTAASPVGAVSINNTNNNNNINNDKSPAKNIANNNLKITKSQKSTEEQFIRSTAEKSIVQDEWQTVKPKGKRRLFKEIVQRDDKFESDTEIINNCSSSNIELDTTGPETVIEKAEQPSVVEEITEKVSENIFTIELSGCANNESESTSEKYLTTDDGTPKSTDLQNSQRKTKTRNKKQKKSPNAINKKSKEGEIIKGPKSNQKTDPKFKTNSKMIEVKDSPKVKKSMFSTPTSSDEDLTLDSLYLLDRKNCLLAKNFRENPLDIFNRFDCKFKGNSSILKEEEEMVLSVIKSLSTNQSKQHEGKSSYSNAQSENVNHEYSAITENSATLDNGIKRNEDDCSLEEEHIDLTTENKTTPLENGMKHDEDNCGLEKHSVSTVENETIPLENGIEEDKNDCGFEEHSDSTVEDEITNQISSIENDYSGFNGVNNLSDQEEDIDEDTIVQTLPKDNINSVNEKISDTESISDLSSDDFGRKTGPEEITIAMHEVNNENSSEQPKECCSEVMDISPEKTEQNTTSDESIDTPCVNINCHKLQINDEMMDSTTETRKVPNNLCSSNTEYKILGNSNDINEDGQLTCMTTTDHNAFLHENSSPSTDSNAFNENSSDFVLIEFEQSQKEHEEEIDIKAIFGEKMKDIDDEFKRQSDSSSNKNSPRRIFLNEINSEDPLQKEYLPSIEALQLAVTSINMSTVELISNEDAKESSAIEIFTSDNETRNSEDEIQCSNISVVEKGILLETATQPVAHTDPNTIITVKETHTVCGVSLKDNKLNNVTIPENVLFEENVDIKELKTDHQTLEDSFSERTTEICERGKDYQDGADSNVNYNNCVAEICSNTSKSCSSSQVDSDYGSMSVVPLEKITSQITEEDIEKCISPIIDRVEEYVAMITTSKESKNCNKVEEHLHEDNCSKYYSSIETTDSKETFTKEDNSDNSLDLISKPIMLPTISENLVNDPNKYPVTMAVRQWLNNEVKEKTPDPIFRIPEDPKLNTIITTSMMEQASQTNASDDWTSEEDEDESDNENIKKHSKNLQSNPSHVSSVNYLLSKYDRKIQQNDNDSDYNSDSQQRYDDDDNTCERVAPNRSDIEKSERCDLLDYWDDEFIRNPKRWLEAKTSRCPSDEKESVLSTTSSEQLVAPYQSVYGKSIDYNRLLASNYEFLSNNIISFNGNSPNDGDQKTRNTDVDVMISSNGTMLNNNDSFGNNINSNDNCLKPPEVCCIIM